jgi:predicted DNA binding CopG/RHH family protein
MLRHDDSVFLVPFVEGAKATFRKDRRLNIRLSSKDLEAI